MVDDAKDIVYVPVLKWRKGEKVALKHLEDSLKKSLIPLIELVNDEGDNSRQLSKDISSYWRTTAYLDVYYRPKLFGRTALDNVATHNQEIDIIPVVRLDTPPIIMDGIKNVVGMYGNGAAIRLCVNKDQDFKFVQQEVDLIIDQLTTPKNKVDLIIDFMSLDNVNDYQKTLQKMAKKISFKDWRRVVISSGVFPADLTQFVPNRENSFERAEINLWRNFKNELPRNTIYSDYTVRGPQYIQRTTQGSKSVRYTTRDQYQVFRGTQDDQPFKYLVHSLNIRTLYGELYDTAFSWGDGFISEKASQLQACLTAGFDPETYTEFTPGNAGDWVAASVNHHMSVVLKSDFRS